MWEDGGMSTAFAIHDAPTREEKRHRPTTLLPVEGPQKIKHPYYDFGRVLSYNAGINQIIGARGRGKSYGAKKHALKKATSKNREMFLYVRRYEDELIARETFFVDIEHEFPEWDFRANGNTFEMSPASTRDDKKRDWEVIGYAVALTTSQKRKSIVYSRVTTIIFDEYIIEKGIMRYLPGEAEIFLGLFLTVDRYQDKTRAFLLANAVRIENPYFTYWNIIPKKDDTFIRPDPDGFVVVHIDKDENFTKSVLETKFGRMIANTEYAKYAIDNEFSDNHLHMVEPKPQTALHMMNLETRTGSFSVWHDVDSNRYWCGRQIVNGQLTVTLVPEGMTEKKVLMMYNDKVIENLRSGFRRDRMRFGDQVVRNMFIDLFKVQR